MRAATETRPAGNAVLLTGANSALLALVVGESAGAGTGSVVKRHSEDHLSSFDRSIIADRIKEVNSFIC